MGIKPSAEIPGEDSGAILGNDQVGQVYANIRLVAQNLDEIVAVSAMDPADLATVAANIGMISSAVTAAADAATSATNANNSAIAAAGSAANALIYKNDAATSETNALAYRNTTLGYKDLAEAFKNSASASAIAAASSEANAAASATAASNSATAAAGSATSAAGSVTEATTQVTLATAEKTAAVTAKTAAELAETNAETARDAAIAAKVAAELARDEAESIAGGDYVTTTAFNTAMAGKASLSAGELFTGVVTAYQFRSPNFVIDNAAGSDFRSFYFYSGGTYAADIGLMMDDVTIRHSSAYKHLFVVAGASKFDITATASTFTVPVVVPSDAYSGAWNGSFKVATQDAVYDEIEALKALVVGSVKYVSTWNASTNTPAIPAAATANKGYYYKVSVAGATSIDGITDWKVGDWIISTGTAWEKVDNTDQVSTVNSQSGAVVLNGSHILLTGYTSGADTAIAAADSINAAFGKTQGQLNAKANLTGGNSFTGIQTITDASSAELKLTDSGSVVDARIYNDGNLHISCTPRIWFTSDIYTFQSAAAVTWLSLTSAGAAVTGAVTATGNIIGLSLIANGANANFVARGDATNGGQLVLGYGDNLATAITGQGNNTWNVDVPSGNVFRIWRRNAAGVDLIAMSLEEATGSATFISGAAFGDAVSTSGANGAFNLYDRDGVGLISVYNYLDTFRFYLNGADRFTIDNVGNVSAGATHTLASTGTVTLALNRTGTGASIFNDGNLHIRSPSNWYDAAGHTWGPEAGGGGWMSLISTELTVPTKVVTPAITLNGTDLGATLNNKAQHFTPIQTISVNTTAADSHNNAHVVASGASRTLTLNNTASAGVSFTVRFTTAWTITCTSLSKNGATPASGGSVAAGKLVSFLHEGSGTWVATGDIT